jgi:tellurite resistance-related uncharacterized protein
MMIATTLAFPRSLALMRRHVLSVSMAISSTPNAAMPQLPDNVVKYSQVPAANRSTPYFTATTIPSGLLKDHSTKAGTWGVIRVTRGVLEYTIPAEPTSRVFHIQAPDTGIIEPTVRHHVKALSGDLEFVVEFYRVPGTGPVDEKREGL